MNSDFLNFILETEKSTLTFWTFFELFSDCENVNPNSGFELFSNTAKTSMLPRRCSGVVMAAIHLVFSSDSAPPLPVRLLQFIRWGQTLLQWHRPPPPTASTDCIQLERVDPLFKKENRSFRIVNRTEAEAEGCPSNTTAHEQNSPTFHKNIVFPSSLFMQADDYYQHQHPLFLCVLFEISSPMNCRNRKRTHNLHRQMSNKL
jgi:hypothetical protein